MTDENFNKIIEGQVITSLKLLTSKGDEYKIKDADRLECFKIAARLSGKKQTEALAGMMAKHTVSVYEMCNDPKKYSIARWDEKITDSINYLLILRAMIEEELTNEPN